MKYSPTIGELENAFHHLQYINIGICSITNVDDNGWVRGTVKTDGLYNFAMKLDYIQHHMEDRYEGVKSEQVLKLTPFVAPVPEVPTNYVTFDIGELKTILKALETLQIYTVMSPSRYPENFEEGALATSSSFTMGKILKKLNTALGDN